MTCDKRFFLQKVPEKSLRPLLQAELGRQGWGVREGCFARRGRPGDGRRQGLENIGRPLFLAGLALPSSSTTTSTLVVLVVLLVLLVLVLVLLLLVLLVLLLVLLLLVLLVLVLVLLLLVLLVVGPGQELVAREKTCTFCISI